MTFNDSDQPRTGQGRFTDKKQSEPEVTLPRQSRPHLLTLRSIIDHDLRSARDDAAAAQDRVGALAIEAAKNLVALTHPKAAAFTITTRSGGDPSRSEIVGGELQNAQGERIGYIASDTEIHGPIKDYAQLAGREYLNRTQRRHRTVNEAWLVPLR